MILPIMVTFLLVLAGLKVFKDSYSFLLVCYKALSSTFSFRCINKCNGRFRIAFALPESTFAFTGRTEPSLLSIILLIFQNDQLVF